MLLIAICLLQNRGSVNFVAVGDVMLGRHVRTYVKDHGPGYPFAKVRPFLKSHDLFYANLEGPITSRPPELSKQFLLPAGVDEKLVFRGLPPTIVSLANNHTLDCGRSGLAETMRVLESAKVSFCGAFTDPDFPCVPTILEVNGLKVAFMGFSDFPEQVIGTSPGVCYYNKDELQKAVGRARALADVVIVAAHWGIEGDQNPCDRQRLEAKQLAAMGVDLILGCHPHVIQPSEWIPGPGGRRCFVIYSMGDFVFDTIRPSEQRSGIWNFRLADRGVQRVEFMSATIKNGRPKLRD